MVRPSEAEPARPKRTPRRRSRLRDGRASQCGQTASLEPRNPPHPEHAISSFMQTMVDAGRGRAQFESMALRRLEVTQDTPLHPAYVVWELTLALRSRRAPTAARAPATRAPTSSPPTRRWTSSTQLAAMRRARGRAHRRRGLPPRRASSTSSPRSPRAGVRPTMTTGGRGITAALAATHGGGRARHRVGQHRRPRAHARPDARLPRQLRRRHRGAPPPARGRAGHGVEHQPQPAQRRRPRGRSTSTSRRSASRRGRSRSPRRSAARPIAPDLLLAAVGPARRRSRASPRSRASALRRRHPGHARQQPRLLRPRGGDCSARCARAAAITGRAARPAAS